MHSAKLVPSSLALNWLRPTTLSPLREVRREPGIQHASTLDDLLVEFWPGVLRARDLPPSPADRARTAADGLPGGLVLARQTAVWVHTGLYRPGRVDVVTSRASRCSTRKAQVHLEALPEGDVVALGGVLVTSSGRTGVDVARWATEPDALDWLGALVTTGLRADDLLRALESASGLPGIARARRLVGTVVGR